MNFSNWNVAGNRPRRNPALSASHVIVEFDRTKKTRIFAHKLGAVDFSRSKDLNATRNEVAEKERGNITLDGFRYKNIGHVYIEAVVSEPNDSGEFPVYSHGHPLGGTEHGGLENCARQGLQCESGSGTDTLCAPGKCKIGTLQKVKDGKWKYTSTNTYGDPAIPMRYYVSGKEKVTLRTLIRGNHVTFNADNSPVTVLVDKPASVITDIYLPPRDYFSDDFIESFIVTTDERINNLEWSIVPDPAVSGSFKATKIIRSEVSSVEDRKSRFIRAILLKAYPSSTEGFINNRLHDTAEEELRDARLTFFASATQVRKYRCDEVISEEFGYRYSRVYSGLDYLIVVYDRIFELFKNIIQVTESSLASPRIDFKKAEISRPVYSRLPGISEGYRSDPAFSDEETPSQWLTSGVDEFLSSKRESLSSFYFDYLNPETCNPASLDWLAQHVGLFGDLWNSLWDNDIKKAMIGNAYGWWDREASVEVPSLGTVLTPKGEALEKYPFTGPEWVDEPPSTEWSIMPNWPVQISWGGETDNLLKVKLDKIETIRISQSTGEIRSYDSVKYKAWSDLDNTVKIISTDQVRIRKNLWNGLIESKGSLLSIAFLSSVFGLKAHTPFELEVIDAERKLFKPKSGLRNAETTAPILLPYKPDVIQVGTVTDAEHNNYTNQLIADVSAVSTVLDSKKAFFRVPYYYNRDGKSWDRVSYLSRWMAADLSVRVQYAYLSADLWSVGDAFFEPDVVIEEN